MPSTYTLNNGIELIGTGEQSGTWGTTTNDNLGFIDTSLDGQITMTLTSAGTSGSPNALPIVDGSSASSEGRNRLVIFDDSGDLGGTAYVQLTPSDAKKIIYIRNSLQASRSIIVFQGAYSASNDYEIPAGTTAVVFFNGGGSGAVAANLFNNAYFDSLRLGNVSVTAILDEDNMSSDSATALATQQSIKAYADTKQPLDAGLTSISALTTAANKMIYTTASDTYAVTDLTAAGRALLDDASASAQRTTLGLAIGSDVQAYDAELSAIAGLSTADGVFIVGNGSSWVAETGATVRASLGLTIGTDVQAYDADLTAIAGLTSAANKGIQFTGSGTAGTFDLTAAGKALLDDADASAQRTTLGLGTAATSASTDFVAVGGDTMTGALTMSGVNVVLNNSNVVFEGATADNFETTLTVTDPTADRTITLPDSTGTVALTSQLSSYLPLAGGTITGNTTIQTTLTVDAISAYDTNYIVLNHPIVEKYYDYGNVSGTVSLNLTNGSHIRVDLTGTTTLQFNNDSAESNRAQVFVLYLECSTSSTITLTWPTEIDWAFSITPAVPNVGDTDIYVFTTKDNGTTWYGFRAGEDMS